MCTGKCFLAEICSDTQLMQTYRDISLKGGASYPMLIIIQHEAVVLFSSSFLKSLQYIVRFVIQNGVRRTFNKNNNFIKRKIHRISGLNCYKPTYIINQ